jgi:transcription initiation factor TFIID subunit 2
MSSGLDSLTDDNTEFESVPLKKSEIPLLWLRIDPDLDWLRIITLRMPNSMWLNQLERDRDVVAQYDALQGLLAHPTPSTLTALSTVLHNRDIFYRIRVHTAHTIAKLTNKETDWVGLDILFKFFKSHYYSAQTQQLKSNDFANFSAYFLQCAIPEALSLIRDEMGRTPSDVTSFLLDLLRNNDNSRNTVSLSFFLSSFISFRFCNCLDPPCFTIEIHSLLFCTSHITPHSFPTHTHTH